MIQESIRQVLLQDWDPIGINDIAEAQDEYDSYVGGVYRLLTSGGTEDAIIDHLYRIAADNMGLPVVDREDLRDVARKLRGLEIERG